MELLPASRFSYEALTHAYNQTRVDYIVPMPMNVTRLREYVRVYDVNLEASCVAVDGEEVLGIGMLGCRQDLGWITRLGVLPNSRGRGTGRALMNGLLKSASRLGLREMWLEVIKGNEPAHRLFNRFGFQETRELLVGRRPPDPAFAARAEEEIRVRVKRITTLSHEDALILLSHRKQRPNWLNDSASMQNVRNLLALAIELHDGGRGWVSYHAGLMQLTRIVVEVTAGDPTEVTAAVLTVLHQRHANQDAIVENIPRDAMWLGFQQLGYFDTFSRIEMARSLVDEDDTTL